MPSVLRIGTAVTIFALLAPAQDFSKVSIEIIGKSYVFTEGPAWSKDGFLIFSDTPADKLWKWTPGSEPAAFANRPTAPTATRSIARAAYTPAKPTPAV